MQRTHGNNSFDKNYYRRFFHKYSKSEFDKYYNWSVGWFKFLNKQIGLKSGDGKRVLEAGSSIGAFSKVLDEHGYEVIATDVSQYIVKKAKKINPQIDFQVLNIEKPIKIKDKFDVVFAFEVLEHLEDPKKALRNIYKKLNKNGLFIFSTPFVTKRALADPTHINVHEPSCWINSSEKAGFSQAKLVPCTFIPFLYRYSPKLSKGFKVKTDIDYVNCTAFFV